MPWWQESDTFHDDPRWRAMASGTRVTVDQLQAAYCRLKSYAGRHSTSGWLTAADAAELARPKVLERLAERALPDQPPMLHVQGDTCDCYDQWQPGYAYMIHKM